MFSVEINGHVHLRFIAIAVLVILVLEDVSDSQPLSQSARAENHESNQDDCYPMLMTGQILIHLDSGKGLIQGSH